MQLHPIVRSVLRVVAIIGAIAVGAAALVTFLAFVFLNDTVQRKVQGAVTVYLQERADAQVRSIGTKNVIRIGSISYSFFTNRLQIDDVHVFIHDSTASEGQILDAHLSHITCTGLAWFDVMFGDGLALGDIEITSPTLTRTWWTSRPDSVRAVRDTSTFKLPEIPNVDTLLQRALYESLPSYVRPLTINAVRIVDAEFTNHERCPEYEFQGTTSDLTIVVEDVQAGVQGRRPLGSIDVSISSLGRRYADGKRTKAVRPHLHVSDRDSSVKVDSLLISDPHGMTVSATNLQFSYRDRSVTIDTFMIAASESDNDYFARRGRADRIKASGANVAIAGIDLSALSNGTALHVRACTVGSLGLDILTNMRPPAPKPSSKGVPQLNDLARSIPFSLRIDTITVPKASIRYGEYHVNSGQPARLFWDNIAFRAVNVDPRATMTVDASGIFMGAARMKAQFIIPLASRTYMLSATGSLAAIDPTLFNGFVTIAENMRIKHGSVREATFRYTVNGRSAEGWVKASYTDLGVELLDARTKKAGFLKSIVSWVANTFVVRTDNLPTEKNYKTGVIKYTLPPDAAIMQTIWFPIRAGLGDLVGF